MCVCLCVFACSAAAVAGRGVTAGARTPSRLMCDPSRPSPTVTRHRHVRSRAVRVAWGGGGGASGRINPVRFMCVVPVGLLCFAAFASWRPLSVVATATGQCFVCVQCGRCQSSATLPFTLTLTHSLASLFTIGRPLWWQVRGVAA